MSNNRDEGNSSCTSTAFISVRSAPNVARALQTLPQRLQTDNVVENVWTFGDEDICQLPCRSSGDV